MNHTNTSPPRASGWSHPLFLGTVLGGISAVGYTAANIFLRSSIDSDPVLVSAVKALPATVCLGGWLAWRAARQSQAVLPPRDVMVKLLLAGLLGQLGGNVLFQLALGVLGIALTVPICLGSIILSGALLGRIYLQEPVHVRTLLSMASLIAAIWILSLGAEGAYAAISVTAPHPWAVTWAVIASCIAGLAYAVLGVVIRYSVMGRASVAAATWTTSAVGLASLGAISLGRLGTRSLLAVDWPDWQDMLLAGVCNFVAFLALTKALQLTSVIYVNALNATQVAMASLAGVLLFSEPLSPSLGSGVLLTILGLLLMPARRRRTKVAYLPSELETARGVEKWRNRVSRICSSLSIHSESGAIESSESGSTTASHSAKSSSACKGR